jgi:hypothetical protein
MRSEHVDPELRSAKVVMRTLSPPHAFDLTDARALLGRTPSVLHNWLFGLPDGWTTCNEGEDTFSPHDVIAHLIHAERAAWIPRIKIALERDCGGAFQPFDRRGYIAEARNKQLPDLLAEFRVLREKSLQQLSTLVHPETELTLTALHPSFGTVTLAQLLATWVVHDLTHVVQIGRVMANRYRADVGPWLEYLRVLHDRR